MIKKITPSETDCILYSRRPFGLFYLIYDGIYIGIYIGIDNSNGHAWVEEFTSLRQCKKWLLNPWVQAPLREEAS